MTNKPRPICIRNVSVYVLVALTCASFCWAHEISSPTSLLSPKLSKVALYGEETDKEIVPVREQPFDHALRVTTGKKPPSTWDIALALPTVAPVSRWDSILGTFYARCVGSPHCEAKTEYVFAMADEPYTPSAKFMVDVGPEWKKYEVPFVVNEDYAPGKAKVRFRLGFDPQTIEIGGIETVDYSSGTNVHDLPKSIVSYPGREVDTAWRKTAEDRIEKIRKADLKVVVKDKAGNPVPGATVGVRMQKHAFAFGCGINAEQILDPTEDGRKFRDAVKELFNSAALENDLKWPWWERNPKRALAWDAINEWKTDTVFFRDDGSMKPNGRVWKDLIFNKWWTNAQGTTGPEGQYLVRGFLGKYKITVRHGNKIKSKTIALPGTGSTAQIVFD